MGHYRRGNLLIICEKKNPEENLLHMANAKQLTLMGNGKGQPENVKNGSKIVVMWSIFPFPIHQGWTQMVAIICIAKSP